ncbi:tetratricopeptide repeat protein [Cytophagaceae bacterium YF14B1]|uniref:Tetratricopeptide repeat protein n=1 Tax=Xanthocytophaga flava TaxID=3048013 RepID=A0AAE3QUP0_9BACT|nr:tetratricopeptide repeat protein [Xanthocytophaga flavus]MDJ1485737.1 tetratricopeptide repeat protein [Xanthocytophaga flavus]
MLKSYLSIVFTLCIYLTTNACVNEYRVLRHVLLNGKKIKLTELLAYEDPDYEENQIKQLKKDSAELKSIWLKTHHIKAYSDYGAALLYLGRYKEAGDIFSTIEKIQPNLYATASNLGTAYELLGKNDSAYFWIQRSIVLNPESHFGSEWLHLKILEVKLKGMSYLTSQFMLGTDLGNDTIPKSSLPLEKLTKLRYHITHQLDERQVFVKSPEPIVAFLLFQLGNIEAITDDITESLLTYNTAYEYGFRSELFAKRYLKFKQIHVKSHTPLPHNTLSDKELQGIIDNPVPVLPQPVADTLTQEGASLKTGSDTASDKSSSHLYLLVGAVIASLVAGYFIFRNRV